MLNRVNLKYSNIDTIFIPSDKKDLRSKFLKKMDEDDKQIAQGAKEVGGRDGLFLEKPDIIDKYCRRIIPENKQELKAKIILTEKKT